jgi:hypothetical protein
MPLRVVWIERRGLLERGHRLLESPGPVVEVRERSQHYAVVRFGLPQRKQRCLRLCVGLSRFLQPGKFQVQRRVARRCLNRLSQLALARGFGRGFAWPAIARGVLHSRGLKRERRCPVPSSRECTTMSAALDRRFFWTTSQPPWK